MTISEELREWAIFSPCPFVVLLSAPAMQALVSHKPSTCWITDLDADERRTFALLVAEAMESEE